MAEPQPPHQIGNIWLAAIVLWVWHLWPNNNRKTAARLAELEAKAKAAKQEADRARRAVEAADDRLRSMERVLMLISLVEHERNNKRSWPPTELEKALASASSTILQARQELTKAQEDNDGAARK